MQSNRYRDELREVTRAGLRGLERAAAEPGGAEPLLLCNVLERVGDLHRLRERAPAWVDAFLVGVSESEIAAVISTYRNEVAGWPVPEGLIRIEEDGPGDDGLGFAVRRRDQVESAIRTLTDWSLQRRRAPVQLTGWAELLGALREWDEAIAKALDRASAENLLSIRIAIAEPRGWLARLGEPDARSPEDVGEPLAPAGLGSFGRPDDAVLQRYLSTGELKAYVEGYASRSPEFASMLAETIETLWDIGELRGAIVPRLWLKRHLAAAQLLNYAPPAIPLAAADEETALEGHRIDLGAIPGLSGAVDAELEIGRGMVTLRVHSEAGVVRRVQAGTTVTDAAGDGGDWIAECPLPSGSLRLRIEDRSGSVFEEELELHEAP